MANDRRSRPTATRNGLRAAALDLAADESLERFIGSLIDASAGPHECWWFGGNRGPGYARYEIKHGTKIIVHRFVYETLVGPIPRGWVVHHECENKACVNPRHLRAMTSRDHLSHHARKQAAAGELHLQRQSAARRAAARS